MAVPPLPLPTPGQNDWAGPLNDSLELLNQGIGDVNDAATAAENARDEAVLAAQAAEAVGDTNDAIMTSVAQDPGSAFSAELTGQIDAAVPDNLVTSLDVENVEVVSQVPAEDPAKAGTLYLVPKYDTLFTDFLIGLPEIDARWEPAEWAHVNGTTIRRPQSASAPVFTAFSLWRASEALDVEVVTRARFLEHTTQSGHYAGAVVRGSGDDAATATGIYARIRENAEGRMLVLTEYLNGASVGSSSVSALPDPPSPGEWFYVRLRVEGATASAKIWRAATVEPPSWQATKALTEALSAGWVGGMAQSYAANEWDSLSLSIGGGTAKVGGL